jgi:uracil-xanthine permease
MSGSGFEVGTGVLTILAVGAVAVYAPGALRRLPIVLGGLVGYLTYLVLTSSFGWAPPIDFSGLAAAAWVGAPQFVSPEFSPRAMVLIAPVAVVLVAENLGHVKAVAAMTGRNLDRYLGRAFLGDALATIVAGTRGGTGVTTYAENIGVMAVTRVYSTLLFIVAAAFAILLGFSPKFGALLLTIPGSVLGGISTVLFGLIAATGGRIWVENRVNFSSARNLVTAGVTLVLGAGDFSIRIGEFSLGGIGTATLAAIVLYQLLAEREVPAGAGAGT